MKKLISILSAFLLCAVAYGANVYTNSFVRDGVTYVQRGVLTAKDYVVTNVVGGIGGGNVESVNGQTGVVVISEVNSATNWINKPDWIEDNWAALANEANYSTEAGHVPWRGIEEKPDWIGNSKPTYTANEVGALPANGKAVSAEQSDLAENATNARNAEWAAFARDAGNAEYATSAGGVFWFDVYGKPDWLGDEKPTYTATEVGAAPAKTMLVLGGTSPNYDLRLNGVAQTFEQVSNCVANGEVIAKHLNGFYKPTYLSASEIMFDCTGFIAGDVSTRRIHMVKTDNKVALDDTKVLAEEKWVGTTVTNVVNDYVATNTEVFVTNNLLTISQDGAIKWQESFGGYKMDASTALTVNCKDHAVTFVTASGETGLTIVPPGANANGESRDFVVYVNTSGTNSLDLTAFTTIYASDVANTNAVKEKLTALYFTELSADVWMLGRQELNRVKP